jgi:hypothetical protein
LQIPYASEIRVSVSDEGCVAVILQFDESVEGAVTLIHDLQSYPGHRTGQRIVFRPCASCDHLN